MTGQTSGVLIDRAEAQACREEEEDCERHCRGKLLSSQGGQDYWSSLFYISIPKPCVSGLVAPPLAHYYSFYGTLRSYGLIEYTDMSSTSKDNEGGLLTLMVTQI